LSASNQDGGRRLLGKEGKKGKKNNQAAQAAEQAKGLGLGLGGIQQGQTGK
jgi:hypothetical protein